MSNLAIDYSKQQEDELTLEMYYKPGEILIAPQPGPQVWLLSCPANQILFGGARGGGKSWGFLLDWIRHQETFGKAAKGIFFRRSYPELEDAIDKSQQLLAPLGAKWLDQKKMWIMPNGAVLKMRYLDKDSDAANYQGHEYNWMAFDEAEHWPSPAPVDKLSACLRSATKGMRLRFLIAANPGGPGHNWLKARFISPAPPLTPHKCPKTGQALVFIPSRVTDNLLLLAHDPEYVNRLRGAGPPWLVKAWLEGDWNITAGGMFDDVWRESVHVVEPFLIPPTWRVDRSFDWGSSKPFSVGWWAESDGTAATMADGTTRHFPPGTVFRIAEHYGWNGEPNEGCKKLAVEVARDINETQSHMFDSQTYWRKWPRLQPPKVVPGPADASIYDVQNGKCIADDMANCNPGVRWTKADKSPGSRKNGWEIVRKMLKACLEMDPKTNYPIGPKQGPMEEPGLFIFSTCRQWIRTVPSLPRDPTNMDDVDTKAEDHCGDETRYRLAQKVATCTEEELPL